jgi:hypothetical protein
MLRQLFAGFQILHAVLLVVGAIGLFVFWMRTRFWLPKYAHILAAIALLVGEWCVSITPKDAPINKAGMRQGALGTRGASDGLFFLRVLRRRKSGFQTQAENGQ